MRNTTLANILLGVQAVIALLLVIWCWQYITNTRRLHEFSFITNRRQYMIMLARDALEYNKTHPELDRILEAARIKPPAAPNAPAAPPAAAPPKSGNK